ncbi:hypothetical protein INT47_011300 [Mucor saturninus]|uniref:F-box domain-containing protein n=1 Tax=Mucor saturninus TaxID=64648 RepID=A0A8H7RNW1_9FUNG|nr:hypothetical protein INT47_011300 [Mucor saturninus]
MYNSKRSGILTIQRAQYNNWCNNRKLSASNVVTSTPPTHRDNNLRSFPLPPELLLEVFAYLTDCQPALHSASLVCTQWMYCAAPILYSHPKINDTYRWATFILTLTRDRMSFFYGDLIRSLDLSSGKSIEAMKDQEFYRRLSNSNDDQLQQQRITLVNNISDRRSRLNLNVRDNGSIRFQQEQQDYLMKGLPFIIVSTSSLVQMSHTCRNITSLNLSYTSLLYDFLVAETGEYLSTLQRYAVQPGLTHIQIPIEQAIQSIGKECLQLQQVKIQRCEWVTAHVIWMFVYHCPNLKKLDARRSTKCTVKRLIANVLEDTSHPIPNSTVGDNNGSDSSIEFPSSSSSSTMDYNSFFNENANQEEEEEEEDVDDDNLTVHFRLNEETGLYEQLEIPNESRMTLVRQHTEEPEESNDAFWIMPFPTAADEMHPIGLRPPSPPNLNSTGNNKSLKNIVYDILSDAKESGASDLHWLQDY